MGHISDNAKFSSSSIPHRNDYNVRPIDNINNLFHSQRNEGRMATLIKILYSSYLGNLIGGSVLGLWLYIDFNDLKIMVLGIMSMIWVSGRGMISLYRLWIKAQREKLELEREKHKDTIDKENQKVISIREANTGK